MTLVYHVTGQQYCQEETHDILYDIDRILCMNERIITNLVHGIFEYRWPDSYRWPVGYRATSDL